MIVIFVVLGALGALSVLVLYACAVVGERYDRQSERWLEQKNKREEQE